MPEKDSFSHEALYLFNRATHLLALGDENGALAQLNQIPSALPRDALGRFIRSKARRLRLRIERAPRLTAGLTLQHDSSKFIGALFAINERLFTFRGMYADPLETLRDPRSRNEWMARQSAMTDTIVIYASEFRFAKNERTSAYGLSVETRKEPLPPEGLIQLPPRPRRRDAAEKLGIFEGFRGIAWQESDRGRSQLTEIAISALYQVSGTVRWLEPQPPTMEVLRRTALRAVARAAEPSI